MFQMWGNTIFTLIYTLQAQTEVMHILANLLLSLFILFVWLLADIYALLSNIGSWLNAGMGNRLFFIIDFCAE